MLEKKWLGAGIQLALIFFVLQAEASPREIQEAVGTSEPKVSFQHDVSGRLGKKGGRIVSFSLYESADGVKVQSYVETFQSDAGALEEMNRMIRSAIKVIERTTTADPSGNVRVTRAVLEVRFEKDKNLFQIVWTEGRLLRYVDSLSLELALAYDKARVTPR